ncbi:MAG TPA: hypothetical protein VGK74_11575 [Symbiobacteriaceae bacterium]|jgi:hypothetical protein
MVKSFSDYQYKAKDGFPAHWFVNVPLEDGGTLTVATVVEPGEEVEILLMHHTEFDRHPNIPTNTKARLGYPDLLTTLKDAAEQNRQLIREVWRDSPLPHTVGEMVMLVTEPTAGEESYVVLADRRWCRQSLEQAVDMGIAFPATVARGWFQTSGVPLEDGSN